jgi:hypothetical protein
MKPTFNFDYRARSRQNLLVIFGYKGKDVAHKTQTDSEISDLVISCRFEPNFEYFRFVS